MHHTLAPRFTLAGLLSLALLAACSDGAIFDSVETPVEQPRSFSEQEKLAARKLSMGSSAVYDGASGPYEQALLCRSAIEALAEWYRQSDGQAGMQVQAIGQAAAIFDRRLQTLGSQEGKSQSTIRSDLEQSVQDGPDIGAQAQMAVTCLQGLQ